MSVNRVRRGTCARLAVSGLSTRTLVLYLTLMQTAAKLSRLGAMESVRISVTVPATDHHELERIAEARRVSLAWVVRDAITQYLAAQEPLFRRAQQ